MPGRDERFRDTVRENNARRDAPALGKWLSVTDANGDTYEIAFRDIGGKDEYDYMLQTQGQMGGLCDIFLEGKVTLVGVAGLIWSQRRKFERKLTVRDVVKTVNMETVESMELHDPEDDDDDDLPLDAPERKLAEMREQANAQVGVEGGSGLPGFGDGS